MSPLIKRSLEELAKTMDGIPEKYLVITGNFAKTPIIMLKNSLFIVFLIHFFLLNVFAHELNEYSSLVSFQTGEPLNSFHIDSYPDSLLYDNMVFFFRRTPIALKQGFDNIYHDNEVDKVVITDLYNFCKKGYRLSWIVKNDSLFIQKIYPQYALNQHTFLHNDTVVFRMEKFIGRSKKNDLLFVEWVTGDFRVLTRHITNPSLGRFDQYDNYRDDRQYGSIISVKNGLIVDFKDDMTNNPTGQNNIVQRELDYIAVKNRAGSYVDAEPDSLLHNDKMYFFRQSPISSKFGFTNVYNENEVSIFNATEVTKDGGIVGLKGYHLTWVSRNDSLFISDIYPTFYCPQKPTLCKDTIFSRMQTFTNGRMINGLLFVDWISGFLGLVTGFFTCFLTAI